MRLWPLLLLALAGCDFAFSKPVEIELPDTEPRLVVGGFLSPDGPVEVRVGRSVSLLSPADTAGTRALGRSLRAALYDDAGRFLDSLRIVAGAGGAYPLFRSAVVPAPGRRYELRASAAGLPDVRAVAEIPVPAVLRLRRETDAPDGQARVTLAWDDRPGAAVYQIALTDVGDDAFNFVPFASTDPLLRTSYERLDASGDADPAVDGGVRYFGRRAVFRDAAFDGRTHETVLTVYARAFGEPRPFRATLSVVSADYVRYQQSVEVQRASSGNPFVQPSRVFSNVEGGLGAFVGSAGASVVVN